MIDKNEFDNEYQEYSNKLNKQRSYFYKHIEKTEYTGLSEDVKQLWSMKL